MARTLRIRGQTWEIPPCPPCPPIITAIRLIERAIQFKTFAIGRVPLKAFALCHVLFLCAEDGLSAHTKLVQIGSIISQGYKNMISSASFYLPEQPSTPQPRDFDYTALDTETQIVIQQRTSEIKSLMRRTATDIIDIGIKLTDVKAQFGHGHFRNWLKAEFNWSISAATKFMQVSEQFKCVNFTHLNITASALYLLAAPSIPKQARGEALERATQGEAITYTEAKAIVTRHKKAAFPKAVKSVTVDVAAETVETSFTNAAEPVEAPQTVRPKELQLSHEPGGNPKQQRPSLPVTDPPTRVASCFIEETSELLDEQSSDELNKRAEQLGLLGIGAQVRLNVKRNHSKSADVDDDSEASLPRKPISVNTRDICTLLISTVQYLSSEQIDALWQALAHRIPKESRYLHHWKEAELMRIIKDAQHELNSRYHPEYFKA